MRTPLLLSLLFISLAMTAQPPVAWSVEKTSFLIHENYGASVVTDPQGNVYCAGQLYESASLGNSMLLKLDPQGNEVWTGLYKGAGADGENKAVKVVRGASGNLYMVGQVTDRDGDLGIWKYSPNGKLIWNDNYTPSWFGEYYDEGYDIAIDSEENAFIIGVVTSTDGNGDDVMTVGYDSAGNILWEQQYTGASDWDYPSAICAEPNGNVYSTSGSFNFFGTASRDMTILHYDKQGTGQWKAYYTGPSGHDYSKDIETDGKGNVWVCGQINTNNYDMGIAQFNQFGTKVWSKTYDGSAGMGDTALSLALHSDGSVTVIGKSMEDVGGNIFPAMTVIHYDNQGNEQWNKQFYGPDALGIEPATVFVDTTTDIIYVTGTTYRANNQTDGIIIRLTAAGVEQWTFTYDGTKFKDDGFMDVTTDLFGNVIASGYANGDGTGADVLVIRLGTNGPTSVEDVSGLNLTIYPNPTQDVLTISGGRIHYELLSTSQQVLQQGSIAQTGSIDIGKYPSGIYLLMIETEDGNRRVEKIIHL